MIFNMCVEWLKFFITFWFNEFPFSNFFSSKIIPKNSYSWKFTQTFSWQKLRRAVVDVIIMRLILNVESKCEKREFWVKFADVLLYIGIKSWDVCVGKVKNAHELNKNGSWRGFFGCKKAKKEVIANFWMLKRLKGNLCRFNAEVLCWSRILSTMNWVPNNLILKL